MQWSPQWPGLSQVSSLPFSWGICRSIWDGDKSRHPQPPGNSTPQPKGDSTPCRPEALAANPEYRMQPYPKDIFDEIDREPLAQQRLARANYVGLKVSWRTTLE